MLRLICRARCTAANLLHGARWGEDTKVRGEVKGTRGQVPVGVYAVVAWLAVLSVLSRAFERFVNQTVLGLGFARTLCSALRLSYPIAFSHFVRTAFQG